MDASVPARNSSNLNKETVPGLRWVAAFHGDPASPGTGPWLRATEAATRGLGLAVHPVPLLGIDPVEWRHAFETVARRGIGAATIAGSPRYEAHRQLLADLALQYRLPMVGTVRTQAEAGGFMSFEPDNNEVGQRVGYFAARILKGAKPAELPVEQPTKFELVINRKTARALGLTIPPAVLPRADEIIEQ